MRSIASVWLRGKFWELITLKSTVLAVTSELLSEFHEQCQAGLEISCILTLLVASQFDRRSFRSKPKVSLIEDKSQFDRRINDYKNYSFASV